MIFCYSYICTTCLDEFIPESMFMKNTNGNYYNDEIFLTNG